MIEELQKSYHICISFFKKIFKLFAQLINKNRFGVYKFVLVFIEILLTFQLYNITGCSPFRKGGELTKFKNFQFSFEDPSNSKYFSVLFSQTDTFFLSDTLIQIMILYIIQFFQIQADRLLIFFQ